MIGLRAMVLALIVAGLPATGLALDCRTWTRLDGYGRSDTIAAEARQVIYSNRASAWQVNRGRIEQCVLRSQRSIAIDFDSTCEQGQRASMRALDEILLNYVRSCVY
jgi:hypothetical protein